MKIIKKNLYVLGLVLGSVLPLILFSLLFGVNQILSMSQGIGEILRPDQMLLLSLIINLLPLRLYFVNLKYEKTGIGVLVVTFIYIMSYFAIYL